MKGDKCRGRSCGSSDHNLDLLLLAPDGGSFGTSGKCRFHNRFTDGLGQGILLL